MPVPFINLAALRGSPLSPSYRATVAKVAEAVDDYAEIRDLLRELVMREWPTGGTAAAKPKILVRTSTFVAISPNRWKYGFAELEFVWLSGQQEQKVATAFKPGGLTGNPSVAGSPYVLNAYELGNDGAPPEMGGSPYIGASGTGAPLQPMPLSAAYMEVEHVFTEPSGAKVYLGSHVNPLRPTCPGAGHVTTGPGIGGGAAAALMALAERVASR